MNAADSGTELLEKFIIVSMMISARRIVTISCDGGIGLLEERFVDFFCDIFDEIFL